jgi:hypothetical protein
VEAVSEIGSGLNGQRPKLKKLLANPAVQTIVVEHRDRLMRWNLTGNLSGSTLRLKLTCLRVPPSIPQYDWPNSLALSNRGRTRWRRYGRCLQG